MDGVKLPGRGESTDLSEGGMHVPACGLELCAWLLVINRL